MPFPRHVCTSKLSREDCIEAVTPMSWNALVVLVTRFVYRRLTARVKRLGRFSVALAKRGGRPSTLEEDAQEEDMVKQDGRFSQG
jgi:hypothetical protein